MPKTINPGFREIVCMEAIGSNDKIALANMMVFCGEAFTVHVISFRLYSTAEIQ
jgi:hypothetical protein